MSMRAFLLNHRAGAVSLRRRRMAPQGLRVAMTFASWCVLFPSEVRAESAARPRYLVVRYDDYTAVPLYARSSKDPDIERRLFALFANRGARLVVGVVPFGGLDDDVATTEKILSGQAESWLNDAASPWVRLLKEYVDAGVVEPALHGLEHRRRTPLGFRPGEFQGRPLLWQRSAIHVGREALEHSLGVRVRVFIPPWNAWDGATAAALQDERFEWLSPDLHHASYPPKTIPVVPQCTGSPSEALSWVIRDQEIPPGSVLLLVTHPFDFEEAGGEKNLADLDRLLQTVSESPSWSFAAFRDLPADEVDWDRRFQAAVASEYARRFLYDVPGANVLISRNSPCVIYPADGYATPGRVLCAAMWGSVAVALIVGAIAGGAGRKLTKRSTQSFITLSALSLVAAAYLAIGAAAIAARGYQIRGIRWLAIGVAGGFLIGLLARSSGATRRPAAPAENR